MTVQALTHVRTSREGVVGRRDFLRTLGVCGAGYGLLGWKETLMLHADELRRRNMACILLFMRGGPSQMLIWLFSVGVGQVREPFDTVGGDLRQGVAYPASRYDPVRRDLGERNQHEAAFEQAGVRQG